MYEREMRTIVEAARSMLHAKNLPLGLWAEAVNLAVFILNGTGTSSIRNKTPYELWFEKHLTIPNLFVFGQEVIVHIAKQKRYKWDAKAEKCLFVGYDSRFD